MKINFYTILCFAVFPFIANAQQLKINEVMASNTATLASDLGNFGDWVELYNLTNADIDLSGLYFTDDITIPTKYQFPTGLSTTIVPANGFKLVWADDSAQALHANFKLSGTTGETIAIFAADGITLIDSISFGTQTTDVSFGRTTDGGASWTTFTVPTPGASNDPTTLQNNIAPVGQISVYPNPSNDVINVAGSKWQFLQIIDITGKIMMSVPSINSGQQAINISNLEKGVYLLQLSNNNTIYNKHLIKY
jgi:hypothetical protein